MKIVLPVHHFPPRYTAGAELYTFRLARWLIAHGHTVEVVCIEHIDQSTLGEVQAERDHYEGVPVWRLALGQHQQADAFAASYNNRLIGNWFAGYLQQQHPDLVHLQSGYLISASVLEAAQRLGIPSLLTLHDFWFLCPRTTLLRGNGEVCTQIPSDPAACAWCMRLDSRRYRFADQATRGLVGRVAQQLLMQGPRQSIASRRAYLRQALTWPRAVIAPSHFLANMFRELVDPERLAVIRLGIDTTQLRQISPPTNGESLRLGYIGQIAPHKGLHILVQAMQLLPAQGRPVELLMYGDTQKNADYSRQLQQQIGADPRIQLLGRFDNSRIAEVLQGIDATVVPSIWYENSPLAILEAQAAGRPAIVSALGGMAELVRNNVDGLHFRAGDAADLARQIQRLREQPPLLTQLHQGTRQPPTVDEEMATLFAVYQRVVAAGACVSAEVI